MALPGQAGSGLLWTRLGVGLLSTAGCTIGLLPSIVYLDRGYLVAGAVVLLAVLSIVAAFQIQPTHVHQPGPLEFMAAGLSAISQGALVSIMALVFYIAFRWAHWLANAILGWFGLALPFPWVLPATILGAGTGVVALIGVAAPTVKGVWQALYPPVAGFPTPFRRFARSTIGQVVLSAAVVAAVAFTVFALRWPLSRLGFWPCLVIAYVLMGATIHAWLMSQEKTAPRTFTSSQEAIGAMLRTLGYQVVAQPRTGFPEIDPFLAELDFAVSRDDQVYAMLIRDAEASPRSDVECVTQVLIATRALVEGAKKLGGELPHVQPVLVLIGGRLGDDPSSFEPSGRVLILRLPNAKALQTANRDERALRLFGAQLFDDLADAKPAAAAGASAAGRVGAAS
jgi:hypothetical protein